MNYWLLKSEPEAYSIDHLAREHETIWDGIRNYQARNYLKSAQVGDLCFFYHSSTEAIGIAGLCTVTETMVIDPTQFDPTSDYFDPKSTVAEPRWHTVRVRFVEKFAHVLTLPELQNTFSGDELMVVRKANRLSGMPVSDRAAQRLLALAARQAG
ncbi:MAG TPA: EVE domain-containing protein [Caldilineaceae bacterium]|nr:EVE domain-containing protein [Caldilineaceae bacterium]